MKEEDKVIDLFKSTSLENYELAFLLIKSLKLNIDYIIEGVGMDWGVNNPEDEGWPLEFEFPNDYVIVTSYVWGEEGFEWDYDSIEIEMDGEDIHIVNDITESNSERAIMDCCKIIFERILNELE